jgi:hypothetical protein
MQPFSVPRGVILTIAAIYAILLATWLLFTGDLGSLDWVTLSFSLAIAATFTSFAVAFSALLRFLGSQHPSWLNRGQAGYVAVAGLLVQSLLAGVFTIIGVWPHKYLWFLGVVPFLWQGGTR